MTRPLRILLESSNYYLDNLGDIAMLKVALSRIRLLWPSAHLQMMTYDPRRLQQICDDCQPVTLGPEYQQFEWIARRLPQDSRRGRWFRRLANDTLARLPGITAVGLAATRRRFASPGLDGYLQAVSQANLFFVPGGGYFSDAFALHAVGILETLNYGQLRGRPTAMMGCGFETINNPLLRMKARQVLPHVSLIGCREAAISLDSLAQFGVRATNIRVTGDDAIELAYEHRAEELGRGIGINLRIAPYSEVDQPSIQRLRRAIQPAAARYHASLIRLPISIGRISDDTAINRLSHGYAQVEPEVADGTATLEAFFDRLASCRVVVTGSYHAGIFALSQGIPVVAVAKSAHYTAKMAGLASQFGDACQVIHLDSRDVDSQVSDAIHTAWESASRVRSQLVERAHQQIDQGRAAYQALKALV